MKTKLLLLIMLLPACITKGNTFRIDNAVICHDKNEPMAVIKAIAGLQDDIERVTGKKPTTTTGKHKGAKVIVGTYGVSRQITSLIKSGVLKEEDLKNKWESYVITVTNDNNPCLVIAGSDKRGTAYGIYEVSRQIGVSPWYWWADVPGAHKETATVDFGYHTSGEPSVKYRGIFINDEDWGLKPWSATNYEKELKDIGPRTYAKVCELIIRLKGNMLAPAMHSCTGAFYSHPESKLVADSFGVMITTSHCEPLLLNNAAKSEWDSKRDGEWNYKTNKATIAGKWEARLGEAAQFDNIYTLAMRGVHDEGMRGNLPIDERVSIIQQVTADQREMISRHTGKTITEVPQIFVPYKETMDIYEHGLRVPEDVTLVWVDDNYGYMKRVSDENERKRSGRAGVYYHLSYLGAPHDYLWLNTTAPVLMYEELKKSYDTGADRYWLLNVGDIKPMEIGIQTFMDMAWNFDAFDIASVNNHQAEMLAGIFGNIYKDEFQHILDEYYRLAWSRKPEYMGFEYEWDDDEHTGLRDTEFSFANYNDAQQRLADYQNLADRVEAIAQALPSGTTTRESFFQLIQYPVQASYQMNRKFLMAQLNHELHADGLTAEANWAARETQIAYDSISSLNKRYNTMLNGKWKGMMTIPPGYTALYHKKPEVTYTDVAGEKEPSGLLKPNKANNELENCHVVNLAQYTNKTGKVNIIKGIGYDWQVVQVGQPCEAPVDIESSTKAAVEYTFPKTDKDSVDVIISTVPFWPLHAGRGNALGVSVDGGEKQIYNNRFAEYSRRWKDQVMRNGAECRMRFAIDRNRDRHTLSLFMGDPGQMIQRIIIDWGGLKKTYVGVSPQNPI